MTHQHHLHGSGRNHVLVDNLGLLCLAFLGSDPRSGCRLLSLLRLERVAAAQACGRLWSTLTTYAISATLKVDTADVFVGGNSLG